MTFTEFQATGEDVADLRVIEAIAASCGADKEMPGRLYGGELYIERCADGEYMLTIGNHCEKSKDLASLEAQLFDFAVSEGYLDGPTERDELVSALEGLMGYVGGWDSPAGHPCRIAADLLTRIGD